MHANTCAPLEYHRRPNLDCNRTQGFHCSRRIEFKIDLENEFEFKSEIAFENEIPYYARRIVRVFS